jgi:hypothetical protein
MSKYLPIIFTFITIFFVFFTGCFENQPPEQFDFAERLYGTWLKNPGRSSTAVRWNFYENKTLEIQTSKTNLVINETLEFYIRTPSQFCIAWQNGTENCFMFDFTNNDNYLWLMDNSNNTYQFIKD